MSSVPAATAIFTRSSKQKRQNKGNIIRKDLFSDISLIHVY